MVKMRDTALAAVLAVLMGTGVCTALPMYLGFDKDLGPTEFAPYTVISDEKSYEVREYESAAWACSIRNGKIERKREMKIMMFIDLMQYVNGKNSLGEKLEMTAPITKYREMSELGDIKKIEMCYYLPSKHQANPPTPTLETMYINRRGNMKIAVRQFMGMNMPKETWDMEKLMLQKDLKDAGVKNLNFKNCFGAMYYCPRMEEHVNEIWYKIEE